MVSRSTPTPLTIRFLIDECLTPRLCTLAKHTGYAAEHVVHIQLGSKPDGVVAVEAVERGDIFVTNNAHHYRRLYAKFTRHPGLVIILPSVPLERQLELFARVMAFIEEQPSIVDQMVVMRRDGQITIEPWPRPAV
jgi:predicted nuclease of predicted toxin-antitoxin system